MRKPQIYFTFGPNYHDLRPLGDILCDVVLVYTDLHSDMSPTLSRRNGEVELDSPNNARPQDQRRAHAVTAGFQLPVFHHIYAITVTVVPDVSTNALDAGDLEEEKVANPSRRAGKQLSSQFTYLFMTYHYLGR